MSVKKYAHPPQQFPVRQSLVLFRDRMVTNCLLLFAARPPEKDCAALCILPDGAEKIKPRFVEFYRELCRNIQFALDKSGRSG